MFNGSEEQVDPADGLMEHAARIGVRAVGAWDIGMHVSDKGIKRSCAMNAVEVKVAPVNSAVKEPWIPAIIKRRTSSAPPR